MPRIKKLSYLLPNFKTPAAKVIDDGDSVVAGLTDNPTVFEEPVPPIADITTGLTLLKTANSVPENEQNTLSRELLKKRKEDFIEFLLTPASNYGLFIANEDRYTAGLLGLPLNKEETTAHNPSAFTAVFEGVGAAAGTAKVRISDRAGNALFKVFLKVGTDWVLWDAYNTLSFIVSGLPSGSSTIRIIGKKGEVDSPEFDLVVRAS